MKRVTLTVDPDDYATIEKMAGNSGVSASWLIRRSMREFIEHREEDGTVELRLDEAS